jgi:hypothetical protein
MKLISEIIEILSSDKPNLTNALIKTKVLLHRLGQKNLIGWVNKELNGYEEDDELPQYRILPCTVLANVSNLGWRYPSHPIPIAHLDEKVRKRLEQARFYQSIGVLEELANSKGERITSRIPMECNSLLDKGLGGGFRVESAWCDSSKTTLTQTLVEVRSRLLDFMLQLSDEFAGEMSDEEVKNKSQSVDSASIFHNAMFGDNTTIIVGDMDKSAIQQGGAHANMAQKKEP